MENKPKEIWISEDSAKRLLPSNSVSVGLKPLYEDDIKYISEPHHNQIVSELKSEIEQLKKQLEK